MTTPQPLTPVAIEVESIMHNRARLFEQRWEARTRTVNRRLLFLFTVMFLAIGFFAYRGEDRDRQIQDDTYQTCLARAGQFTAYNDALPAKISQMINAANPDLDEATRAELMTSLSLQLQVPALLCMES